MITKLTGIEILSLIKYDIEGDIPCADKDELADSFLDSFQSTQQDETEVLEEETSDGHYTYTSTEADSMISNGDNAIAIGKWIKRRLPIVYTMIMRGYCEER